MHPYRTHHCDELRKEHAGQTVKLSGWVNRKRDHGGVIFIDLRDRDGLTIILVDQEIRQALKIADYVYVLDLGRNKFDGPVEEFSDLEKAFWA